MKSHRLSRLIAATTLVGVGFWAFALAAQPRPIEVPQLNTDLAITSVANVRTAGQSADGTEVTLVMDYTYNGSFGPTARIVPKIESRKQPGVSGWFGADMVAVPRGKGPVSFRVKFFNDEPGAPATLTTDRIQILILNQAGTVKIGGSSELKTIHWGKEGSRPANPPAPDSAVGTESRLAQLAGDAEDRARKSAQLAAEAEALARREASAREAARAQAAAEAKAKAEAQARVNAESQLRAEERRLAEAKAAAELKARDEARLRAEAESRRLEEARRLAESQAKAEAEAQAKARLEAEARQREIERKQAEAAVARLAEERQRAETQAAAEAKAREDARLKAESDSRRLEEEQRAAEARAQSEEAARREAAARADAEAKARVEAEAKAAEAARIKSEQTRVAVAAIAPTTPANTPPAVDQSPAQSSGYRTRITNVDVVNRSLDRSRMTIGIEFELKDKFDFAPLLGVDIEHSANNSVSRYFTSEPKEIGRQKFVLVPVQFSPPGDASLGTMLTDRLVVYVTDAAKSVKLPLHPATMLLVWRAPGVITPVAAASAGETAGSVELADFRQRSTASGYASVMYHLPTGAGQLRVRLKDSRRSESSGWFITEPVAIKAGRGLELIPVTISTAAGVPSGELSVDTVEVDLLDQAGNVITSSTKAAKIAWSRNP